VCGGTGLYLKALTSGLSTLPEIPDPVRRLIRARYRDLDGAALHGVLQARDPEAAARLGPTDVQRLTRALEVIEATGRPLAAWHAQCPPQPALAARAVTIVLLPPRQELYPRLDARFERMIAGGAIDEVRALLAHGRDPDLPAMKAVGVRQLASHLKGGFGLTEACRLAKQATRQYAKRQMTWIRTQMRPDRVWPALYGRDQKSLLRQMIRELMLTPGA
jgi:tRNA dimethylallyltransferase